MSDPCPFEALVMTDTNIRQIDESGEDRKRALALYRLKLREARVVFLEAINECLQERKN